MKYCYRELRVLKLHVFSVVEQGILNRSKLFIIDDN
jgi:hypothetical protein